MGMLVFLFLKLSFFWVILTVFEVAVIRRMKVSTFKYIKLLKFLEFFYVILTIILIVIYLYISNFYKINNQSYLYINFLKIVSTLC